jgi:endo-1,4-beta-mannosidase
VPEGVDPLEAAVGSESDFRLGVNYWPARTAMYWWDDVQASEIDRDMARIADLGLQEARIFALWEHFQPRPDHVSDQALAELDVVLRAAARRGVGIVVSLFCGHMSGVNWLPAWAVDPSVRSTIRTFSGGRVAPGGAGDIYADPVLLEAQLALCRRLASTFAGHEGLRGWDLGNEPSLLRWPDRPDDAASWSALLTEALRPAGVPVVGGLHAPDLEEDHGIRLSTIAAPWHRVAMHGYPLYSEAATAPDDPDWVPFVCAVAAHFAGKPVDAQEFGLPDHELGEERVARYAEAVLPRLWELGAVAASWWCFSDYAPDLMRLPPFDRVPHELHFGLFRADGTAKPVAEAWGRFGRRPIGDPVTVELPDEEAWYAGLPDTLEHAYRSWRERGRPPSGPGGGRPATTSRGEGRRER